jgi:hypothetical protein
MGLTRPTAAQIDSSTEVITDPISLLNNKSNRANVDVGFLFNRDGGISSNVAVFWQESNQRFVFALTSSNAVSRFSNIVVTSNANVQTGNVFTIGYINTTGNVLLGGNLFVGGGFANISSGSVSADSALQIYGNVSRGGPSYHDFLRVTSTASGATNPNKHLRLDGTGNLQIINSAYSSTILSLTDSGILTDGKGDVRSAPQNSQSGAYPLVVGDAGKHISITTGGVTVNANIFSIGDMVTVYNNSGSSQNITQGTSVTLRLAGTATTGTRALAQYGVATLLCVTGGATPTFVCTGAGLT